MGAPRWTEQPKDAGPIEALRVPVILNDGRQARRGLPWDPGGGWTTDDNHEASAYAVNIAIPGVKVLWGSPVDLGPGSVGGQQSESPRSGNKEADRLTGMYYEGERIVIPIPDNGGTFDIQTWAAYAGAKVGPSGGWGDAINIWEWGRINRAPGEESPARRQFNFPALVDPDPDPDPDPEPPTEAELLTAARLATRQLVLFLRRPKPDGSVMPWSQVKSHKYGHAYFNDLGGR